MAAVSRLPILIPSFECRSDPEFCRSDSLPNAGRTRSANPRLVGGYVGCLSTSIFKFPPNFVRQLSNKARRNCSNIGVAQVVAASWSNGLGASRSSSLVRTMASGSAPVEVSVGVTENEISTVDDLHLDGKNAEAESANHYKYASILKSDSSIAIHAGERWDRAIITDAITTPIVNTSAYFFKKTADLIDFKEKRRESYEYGRYGNYTTAAAAAKISALEGAESTLLLASGMSATTVLLMALVPAGGHLITTTDCYRRTRIFIETFLPKMGISATVIDPADVAGLEFALEKSNTALFFTESPTNPFLRCVDIERVSKLCHKKGALVCIDATFATPINQKSLALGADIVMHSATKYIAGHNAIIAGAISGPEELIAPIRNLHHVMGGVLDPHAAFLLIEGMKTISLRVQHQNSTAQRMAELLETHPKIRRVYYPGLKSHPEHELAKKQMTGFGGVVSFEVDGDLLTTAKFIDALKIPYIAPSFGGCESIVDQPAIMSYWDLPQYERAKYGIHDNLVRFSFGLEGFDDLKNDILQALEGI